MCTKHNRGAKESVPPFTSLFLEQPADRGGAARSVNTVLGPVDADTLGVTLLSESLLYVFPGAQYAFDIKIDRAEVFDRLATKLLAFKAAGGGTLVDATGMFEGRDLTLYEALSRATGVHIVASTGQGPEAMLGGYFLTPQTNPPTPWPAQKFAELFGREVNEGMVVPRLERRAPAGMICTAVSPGGMTPTDASLVRGAARAGATYGVPVSIKFGCDARAEMQLAFEETLKPHRLLMGGMDRRDAMEKGWPMAVVQTGAWVGVDHVGSTDPDHVTDSDRIALVATLIDAGYVDHIILSSNATGAAFGVAGPDRPYSDVLTKFAPALKAAGVSQGHIDQMLTANPARLLSLGGDAA